MFSTCTGYWRLEQCSQQFLKTEDSTRDSIFPKRKLLRLHTCLCFCVSSVFSVPPTSMAWQVMGQSLV